MSKKLHELLAVEGQLENQANKARQDLKNTFEKKVHLFNESQIIVTPVEEGGETVIEAQSEIQSTILKELAWISGFYKKSIDASASVAETNTVARANIILSDGTMIAENVPATYLLELEKRLADIKDLFEAIPTLDPAKGFRPDSARGEGFFQAREVVKARTKKIQKPITLYEATKEHPAQVQLVSEDVKIATVTERSWSALITPARKSELLSRVEDLSRAVREARSRANGVEVKKLKIADSIFSFLLQ